MALRANASSELHYSDVIMSTKASRITGVSIVYSTICSGANQRKHQSSASLAFVRGIHRWPMNSPHKGSVTWKMYPFDDVIMQQACVWCCWPAKRVLRANAGVSNDCNHAVSNHKQFDCLFKSLFRPATKKTDHRSTLTALCEGNPPVTSELPQKLSIIQKRFPCHDVNKNLPYQ